MRHALVVAVITVCGAAAVSAQTSPTEFDVATVKPSPPEPPRGINLGSLRPPPGQWRGLRVSLVQYIGVAYPDYAFQQRIVGGPGWVRDAKFDIDVRMAPTTTPAQMAPMMARLLADRFALRTHTEQRPTDVYILKLARADGRLGPGVKSSSATCIDAKRRPAGQPLPLECRGGPSLGLNLRVSQIADLLQYLSFIRIDRPILDRTGLAGYFEFQLAYDCGPFGPIDDRIPVRQCGADSVSFFTALQEQAGLKLEPAREAVDVLVIDSAKMPDPD